MTNEKNDKEILGADAAAVDRAGSIVTPERQAHTPGPWEVQTHLGNNDIHRIMPVFKRTNVGRLPPWEGGGFYIKNAADAHLLAAAPEMLDALKAIEWSPYPQQLGDDGPVVHPHRCMACGRFRGSGHNAVCRVAAAIAKAEGRVTHD